MDEKTIVEAAAIILAGIARNKDVSVTLKEFGGQGEQEIKVFFKTEGSTIETNVATMMHSIIQGIKNSR